MVRTIRPINASFPIAGQQWGLTVDSALNRQEALQRLADARPYDAIILDLQLPDTDGMALAAEIRRPVSGRFPPLLLLSSARLRSDDTRPAEAGVSGYIHKPIRPAQLLEALCRAMSIQLQREKKAPVAPVLDPDLARRLPMRLLLADDNPINQKVGLSVLHKLGYRADIANNGLEVLKALEQKVYDLLFLDVQMPEMDGLEAARKICERWSPERRPAIIAMTGNALMGDREKCLAAGMDDYISKPVRISELQAALERWGPLKTAHSDTKILLRAKATSPDELLDEKLLALLRTSANLQPDDARRRLLEQFFQTVPQSLNQLSQNLSDPTTFAAQAQALNQLRYSGRRQAHFLTRPKARGPRPFRQPRECSAVLQELRAASALTRTQLLPLIGSSTLEPAP